MAKNIILAGFHAVGARLRKDPDSIVCVYVDPQRRDKRMSQMRAELESLGVRVMQAGVALAEIKGKDCVPLHALAMSVLLRADAFPRQEVDEQQAIAYLRKEAIALPDAAPRGVVLLTYRDVPLGFVKNIGSRANNLYPQEWRIRKSL